MNDPAFARISKSVLMTDLASSRKIKRRIGDKRYVVDLDIPLDGIINGVIDRFPGVVKHRDTGDGGLYVFETSESAVCAALLIQDAIANHDWTSLRELLTAAKDESYVTVDFTNDQIASMPGLRTTVTEGEFYERKGRLIRGIAVDNAGHLLKGCRPHQVITSHSVFDRTGMSIRDAEELQKSDIEVEWYSQGVFRVSDDQHDLWEVYDRKRRDGPMILSDVPGFERVHPDDDWEPAEGIDVYDTNWKLVKKLATGGFGTVWLAAKDDLQSVFKFCIDSDNREHLDREKSLLAILQKRINSPNVIRLDNYVVEKRKCYLQVEYLEAGDMDEWADNRGGISTFGFEERLRLATELTEAVGEIHEHHIVHRDIKPTNILMEKRGATWHLKLADFGVAALVSTESYDDAKWRPFITSDTIREPGTASYTLLYSAPEEKKPRSRRESMGRTPEQRLKADVYSIGVILYQLVIGDLSRDAVGWEGVIQEKISDKITGELLIEIIGRCLTTDLSVRSTARQLADDLHNFDRDRLLLLEKRAAEEEAKRNDELAKQNARKAKHAAELAAQRKVFISRLLKALAALAIACVVAVCFFVAARSARIRAEREKNIANAVFASFEEGIADDNFKRPELRELRTTLIRQIQMHYRTVIEERGGDGEKSIELARAHYRLGRAINLADEATVEGWDEFQKAIELLLKLPDSREKVEILSFVLNAIGEAWDTMSSQIADPALLKKATDVGRSVTAEIPVSAGKLNWDDPIDFYKAAGALRETHGLSPRLRANSVMNQAQRLMTRATPIDESNSGDTTLVSNTIDEYEEVIELLNHAASIREPLKSDEALRDKGKNWKNLAEVQSLLGDVYYYTDKVKLADDQYEAAVKSNGQAVDVFSRLIESFGYRFDYRKQLAETFQSQAEVESFRENYSETARLASLASKAYRECRAVSIEIQIIQSEMQAAEAYSFLEDDKNSEVHAQRVLRLSQDLKPYASSEQEITTIDAERDRANKILVDIADRRAKE